MKTVNFEYGEGVMPAELPDSAQVFVPGETVPDPPILVDPAGATLASILNPVGMPRISRLVGPGSRVVIAFPDRVKGGFQATSHRKISLPILVDECLKAGVNRQDITLICSNGLHRKNTPEEIRELIGDEVYRQFDATHQIVNHDSEDWDNLVDLGFDELGDRVILNRAVFEADLSIMIGHVLGNPYGGYSGGYKMVSTGLTHWRCIAAHHIPAVMHRPDFVPANPHSDMRQRMNAIGLHMEQRMGKKFFMCDAVLDSQARQIAVFSGNGREIQPLSWEVANRRTFVPWAKDSFDIVMFGLPLAFQYGEGQGTNPILILQSIAAQVIRHKRVLKENCVVICSSICNGYFHDELFPGYRALYELYQQDRHNVLPDLAKYDELFCSNQEYIKRYRFGYGFHPYHAFSMISCGQIAHRHCAAIYIVGGQEPGYARGMGLKTRATFAEALADATRFTGPNPSILALPRAFKLASVHLLLQDDPIPVP